MPSSSAARQRPAGLPEALVALAAGLSLAMATVTLAGWPAPVTGLSAGTMLDLRTDAGSPPAQAAGLPTGLSIPSLRLQRDLVDLDRRPDGTLDVPADYNDVGRWAGAGPGDPVVLAGHVDSFDGPAVFFRLGELEPGDEVLLGTSTGTVRHRVDRVERHPKDAFPTFDVFTASDRGGLRLVTCGGTFDQATGSYTDNVVVFASPV